MSESARRVVCIDNRAFLGFDEEGNLTAPQSGETMDGLLSIGREYTLLGEEDGFFRVVADDGDDYLFPKEMFRVVAR